MKVFLDYTQEELDRAYDQRAWAPNAEALIAGWAEAAPAARAANPGYREVAYGAGADEVLDLYPTDAPDAPVHIHVHGGAWRAQSKDDAAFAAAAMTAAGMHFVVPEFSKLPAVRMPQMVDQLARAVAWVVHGAAGFGGDGTRLLLSGHSSGAHLAAVLATLDWTAYGLPRDVLGGVVCMSGAYDLEAVLKSARRSYIDLSPEEADRFSPPRHAASIPCPVRVVYGGRETPEFVRQAHGFAAALDRAGRLAAFVAAPEKNHFEIADAMAGNGPVRDALLDAFAEVGTRDRGRPGDNDRAAARPADPTG